MRFLIVGAGAIGGYFGGRLLAAGADVTFLVRERRANQLRDAGLTITSSHGDLTIPNPPCVLSGDIAGPYDVILLSSKAYDLAATMESFAAAVGPATAIIPLLNGMRHIDDLAARFGRTGVLGGLCLISSALDEHGAVRHLNDLHTLTFGELSGGISARVDAIHHEFDRANFVSQPSAEIVQELWEKWVFIASMAGLTCLMRASIGQVGEAGGTSFGEMLVDECSAIAAKNGFAPRQPSLDRMRNVLTAKGSLLTASMFKDVERGGPTEGEHILGDLLARGGANDGAWTPLRVAVTSLRAYEVRRAAGLL